jgi:hypothetical protein
MAALQGLAYAYGSASGPVEYIHSWETQFTFIITGAPHYCGGTGNQYTVFWSQPNASRLYSLVLLSFTTGKLLRVVYYNCATNGDAVTSDIDIGNTPRS